MIQQDFTDYRPQPTLEDLVEEDELLLNVIIDYQDQDLEYM